MKKGSHICILTSGRISDVLFGEAGFSLRLGKWLTEKNHKVILMGSGFIGVKIKHMSLSEPIKQKKKIRVLYPPYIIYMFSRLLFSGLCILKIISLNFRTPIKVIHAQDTGYAGLAAVIAGKILKIPVMISTHGIRHKTLETKLKGKLMKIILKFEYDLDIFTIKKSDLVIALNPRVKEYFEKFVSKKIEFIPNSIKLENFEFSDKNREDIRKEFEIAPNTIAIGYVGRFAPEKNLFTLLTAFKEVEKTGSCVKLILVGAGLQEPELREYVYKNGIKDKVIFSGTRNDVGRILSGFDIFVLPSLMEGLSTVLLEAMTCARPIICSDITANQELVRHNQEGILVDPKSPKELEEAIQLLSKNESLGVKLGLNAKKIASKYNEELIFPKILQQYHSLTQGLL